MSARVLSFLASALCAATSLALSLPAAGAELYRWTDADGRTHYSDKAPEKGAAKKVELKINTYQGAPVVSSLGTPAAGIGKGRVKMYTTAWCGYCKKARAHLNARRIPYEDLDVERSSQAKQEFVALKGRGVPVILVGNQRMDGFDASQMDSMLKAAGH